MWCFGRAITVCSFLKPEADKFILADKWFGHLSISRQLASPFAEDADPMHQLEMDLKTGLTDSDHERVLDSIRMLGNMRHLRSKVELYSLVNSSDTLMRTYIYEALRGCNQVPEFQPLFEEAAVRATTESGAEEPGVAVAEDAAAWEMTMNSNDFPSTLNFILFLSSVNWIAVFNGMMVCSEGFG